jgi:hypothetical protein
LGQPWLTEEGEGTVRRIAFVTAILFIIASLAVIAGCGSDSGTSQGDGGGRDVAGKAQALVFTSPG